MDRVLLVLLLLTLPMAGCLGSDPATPADTPPGDDQVALPGVLIETRLGTITAVLYPDIAPETVAQVAELARSGWYNGSTFYRTVDNFVIQGGEPEEDESEQDTVPLEAGGYFAAGTLGLARDMEEDSGTSHFFITEYPQPHLRDPDPRQSALGVVYGAFTAFGQVVDGMDVVRAIAELPHDGSGEDRPEDPPVMTVHATTVLLPADEAGELPYRTWGRQVATPYRISVDSPGTLTADEPTWLRVFLERQAEAGTLTEPSLSFEITDSSGAQVDAEAEVHASDRNLTRLSVTFPASGSYTLTVQDGIRELASFELAVE